MISRIRLPLALCILLTLPPSAFAGEAAEETPPAPVPAAALGAMNLALAGTAAPPVRPSAPLELTDQEMREVQRNIKLFFRDASRTLSQGRPDVSAEVAARNGGPLSEQQVEELEVFRSEMSLLLAAIGATPGTDHDAEQVTVSHQQIRWASPDELYLLRDTVSATIDWRALSARLAEADVEILRPLAEHGPLSSSDERELESFHRELTGFLEDVERVPPEVRERFGLRSAGSLGGRVASLSPEVLFLLREQIDHETLRASRQGIQAVIRLGTMTAGDRVALEAFRNDLLEALAPRSDAGRPAEKAEAISSLSAQQLVLYEASLSTLPNWQLTVPLVPQVARSPELAQRLDGLRRDDEAIRLELQALRVRMLDQFASLEGSPEIDPFHLSTAARFVREAPDAKMAFFSEAISLGSLGDSPLDLAAMAVTAKAICPGGSGSDPLACLGTIGRLNISCNIDLPSPVPDVDPCKKLNSPINDNIIDPLNNSIISPINTVIGKLNGFITTIGNTVSNILTKLTTIFDIIVNADFAGLLNALMNTWLGAAKAALGAIGGLAGTVDSVLGTAVAEFRSVADGVKQPFLTLIDELNPDTAPASGPTLFGELNGLMFNRDASKGPLGLVPCMENILCETTATIDGEQYCTEGKVVPLLGEVGSDLSVWACTVVQNEINLFKDMMPEDMITGSKLADIAVTLFVHPIEVICAVNDFMAGAREAAEEKIADLERQARFDHVLGSCELDLANEELDCPDLPEGMSIAEIVNGNRLAIAGVQGSVDTLISNVDMGFSDTSTQLNAGFHSVRGQLATFEALEIQLKIEVNLALVSQADKGAVSLFMLPEAVGGLLETAVDVVDAVIQQAAAAGLDTKKATRYFLDALGDIDAGRYRDGYGNLANAYGEIVRR